LYRVKPPDAFSKVIIRGSGLNEKSIAWIIPNSKGSTRKSLDKYTASIEGIESITGEVIPVFYFIKYD